MQARHASAQKPAHVGGVPQRDRTRRARYRRVRAALIHPRLPMAERPIGGYESGLRADPHPVRGEVSVPEARFSTVFEPSASSEFSQCLPMEVAPELG